MVDEITREREVAEGKEVAAEMAKGQDKVPPPKLSILEETKAAIAEMKKEREEMTKIKDELQQLRSDQLLSGSAGGHIEPEKPKEETALAYQQRIMSGGANPAPTETDGEE